MRLNNIKGAIFDLDGTIIDSMRVWDTIPSAYLRSKGIVPQENLGNILRSMNMKQGAEYVKENYRLVETSEEIIAGINEMVASKYREEIPMKDGVFQLIEKLDTMGVVMCVATVTDYHLAERCLKRIGILKYLKGVYTCGNLGLGKENPKIFEYAMEKLGTSKADTYIFEDSLYAIQTAKEAGFKVVAVYDKASDQENKQIREKADIYVTTMEELYR